MSHKPQKCREQRASISDKKGKVGWRTGEVFSGNNPAGILRAQLLHPFPGVSFSRRHGPRNQSHK